MVLLVGTYICENLKNLGIKAVNRIIDTGLSGMEFIAIDFDATALARMDNAEA